ncbi:hypothetical protein BH23BAC2_BH23BAC2_12250 [soil metagenome]
MNLKPFIFMFFVILAACSPRIDSADVVHMRVNSTTVNCIGVMEGTCLLVQEGNMIGTENWEYFYYVDSIEGFSYEPGFIYNLRVRKTEIKNPMADGSSVRYELLKIISKEAI